MEAPHEVVIVGGGMAAAKAIEAARETGYDGNVRVVTEEDELPYERPPLSKKWLIDGPGEPDVHVHDQAFYCLLYTSPSPRDGLLSRMPSSA